MYHPGRGISGNESEWISSVKSNYSSKKAPDQVTLSLSIIKNMKTYHFTLINKAEWTITNDEYVIIAKNQETALKIIKDYLEPRIVEMIEVAREAKISAIGKQNYEEAVRFYDQEKKLKTTLDEIKSQIIAEDLKELPPNSITLIQQAMDE